MIEKKNRDNIEILAPAGSMESMTAAFNAGADAVYMGGSRFGARAYADNPGEADLKYAIDYAHIHHKKLYLTLNTLLKEEELESAVYDFLKPYYEEGLDGVIIQDFGLFSMLKSCFPELPLHASTQMTITGTEMARWLENEGMERIVLARELSLEEIKDIRQSTGMELEVFVQGALCYCYSGQCLMSSMIGGRSGNRGRCAQPCRLPYQYGDSRKPSYLLSPKDICTLTDLTDLIDAGVNSFKIEGRMKKPEYAALTAWLYRHYADRYLEYGREKYRVDGKDMEKLMDLYNRGGFSRGYLHVNNGPAMISKERPNHMGVLVGSVSRKGSVRTKTGLYSGDVLEIRGGKEDLSFRVSRDVPEGGTFIPEIDKKNMKTAGQMEGRKVFRVRNSRLIEALQKKYGAHELKEKIYGTLRIVKDFPAMLKLSLGDVSVSLEGGMVEAAKNQPMTDVQLQKPILKTGNTPFEFERLEVLTDGCSFVPNQQLNGLRRDGLDLLKNACLEKYFRHSEKKPEPLETEAGPEDQKIPPLNVLLTGSETLKKGADILAGETCVQRFYVELHEGVQDDFKSVRKLKDAGKEVYFALPGILRKKDKALMDEYLRKAGKWADGYLVRQMEGFLWLKEIYPQAEMVFDWGIYGMNRRAKAFLKSLAPVALTAPQELNYQELLKLGCRDMEMVVYGHQQLMISAQCVKKTEEGCTKKPEMIQLTDRQHKHFYVYNECTFCYNKIYNGLPTMLLDKKDELLRLNPAFFRMDFTMETEKEMAALVQNYRDLYIRGEKGENILKDFTRGHFTRRVE